MTGASAALCISDIPFDGPIGAVCIGRVGGEYKINPTLSELEESDIHLMVSGNRESIISVEGDFHEVPDDDVVEALRVAQEGIVQLIELQDDLIANVGKAKRSYEEPEENEALVTAVAERASEQIHAANRMPDKMARAETLSAIRTEVREALAEHFADDEIGSEIDQLIKKDMRAMILAENQRIDGRDLNQVRPIDIDLSILPRAHGSAIFTRGQTQALCVATLGSKMDTRMVDDLEGKSFKSFMLDYNFPNYSVGETGRIAAPGRREIGHGVLAEKALEPVVPSEDHFPYTIRLVSEILESNSSSSMASVCGSSLALMDAGVPIKSHVAGAGVGLVMEGEQWAVLTDILGEEDHLGDMDLKIAGTRAGLTAIQMDIKIGGISFEILNAAFARARDALNHILGLMEEAVSAPRTSLSEYAPRILSIRIDPSKIGAVIGPGGKTIRSIEETGATVSVEDDGLVTVTSLDAQAGETAMGMVEALVEEAEVGRTYEGTVRRITDFGAFVEILPGKDGLCHISELEHHRVRKVNDVLSEGEKVQVKVIAIDDQGKIRLSRKVLIDKPDGGSNQQGRQRPPQRS
jgi:polyribonucleotide nucleotidyltransferase